MAGEAETAARALAERNGLRFVDLARTVFAPGAAALLTEETARRFRAVPLERRRGTTVIAVADPTDPLLMDAVSGSVNGDFVLTVAPAEQVTNALTRLYGAGPIRTRPLHAAPNATGSTPTPSSAFSNADALLAEATSGGPTLEDALRDVLVPPDVRTTPFVPPAAPGSAIGQSNGTPPRSGSHANNHEGLSPTLGAIPAAGPTTAGTNGSNGSNGVHPVEATSRNGSTSIATEVLAPGAEHASNAADANATKAEPSVVTPDVGVPGLTLSIPTPPVGYGVVAEPSAELQWPPLARVLVTSGRVSYENMARALEAHRLTGESLARYLYNQKLATEDDLVRAMAEEVGLEFVDLGSFPIDPNVAALIPPAVARRHMVLPIRIEDGVPLVAMANPTDVFAIDDLRTIMGRSFTPVVATRTQLSMQLRQLQEAETDVEGAAQDAAGTVPHGAANAFELESLQAVVEDAPIVRYVNLLILQALNERASDIHIEPSPRRLRIRFRIDGVMHDASSASPAIHAAVVSRLKVLGEMDITEHRLPQEGRVSVSVGDRQIDLRLSTLPSLYGETVVMRLLDKTASIRKLPELGFLPDTLERYAHTYNHPYGVILVTGPTGAGKTTTLYATLQEVMSKEKSVVTVEDPVEYQIDGITQVQINSKAGLQFGTALRAILRADPDIVLVGEIRDIETATIAMEAALSGHLVLTTLHTNTAASTPLRLTEMGIEPFLVTSAIGSVLTQRLARVLCERCKTPYDASLTDFYGAGYREVDLEGLDVSTLHRANGCRTCGHTGYYGRMVLAEVMEMTEDIERMIIEQQSIVSIERAAVEQGMRTLRQDGLVKALQGLTTLEEVLRVVV